MKTNKILLLNDYVSTSHVALSIQNDYLINRIEDCISVPTAIFSNTFNLGTPVKTDTTDFLQESLLKYNSLDYTFLGLLTGYLHNTKQASIILEWLNLHEELLFVIDPVMGDNGKLYKSLTSEMAHVYRQLAMMSDVVVPNMTEAQLLLQDTLKTDITENEATKLIDDLRKINNKSVVITSTKINHRYFVVGYDHKKDMYLRLPFDKIEGIHYGTGDLFSAALFYQLLKGNDLESAIVLANEAVLYKINREKIQGNY